jgi:hypothetical protein
MDETPPSSTHSNLFLPFLGIGFYFYQQITSFVWTFFTFETLWLGMYTALDSVLFCLTTLPLRLLSTFVVILYRVCFVMLFFFFLSRVYFCRYSLFFYFFFIFLFFFFLSIYNYYLSKYIFFFLMSQFIFTSIHHLFIQICNLTHVSFRIPKKLFLFLMNVIFIKFFYELVLHDVFLKDYLK